MDLWTRTSGSAASRPCAARAPFVTPQHSWTLSRVPFQATPTLRPARIEVGSQFWMNCLKPSVGVATLGSACPSRLPSKPADNVVDRLGVRLGVAGARSREQRVLDIALGFARQGPVHRRVVIDHAAAEVDLSRAQ